MLGQLLFSPLFARRDEGRQTVFGIGLTARPVLQSTVAVRGPSAAAWLASQVFHLRNLWSPPRSAAARADMPVLSTPTAKALFCARRAAVRRGLDIIAQTGGTRQRNGLGRLRIRVAKCEAVSLV